MQERLSRARTTSPSSSSRDYPLDRGDILHRGRDAWDAALNTVNIGKYNLGWASIGICTHALYEAIAHASNRGSTRCASPTSRTCSRCSSTPTPPGRDEALRAPRRRLHALGLAEDRRYLLYNPMVKMKVTTEGERVINLLWDVIAAKGFEKGMYFEQAAVDIRGLPKLEGTVHVNIALIVKFMPSFFFAPAEYPAGPRRRRRPPTTTSCSTRAPPRASARSASTTTGGPSRASSSQRAALRRAGRGLPRAAGDRPAGQAQMKDIDFLLAGGELFALVVYAQLILENARIYGVDDDLVDQIFDFLVRDLSKFALQLHSKPSSTEEQMACCLRMMRRRCTIRSGTTGCGRSRWRR